MSLAGRLLTFFPAFVIACAAGTVVAGAATPDGEQGLLGHVLRLGLEGGQDVAIGESPPFTLLWPLKPRLSPPFFAAAVVPSP